MLYPNRASTSITWRDARLLAVGAAVLFALSAFLAFAGSLNGAFGLFAAAMALHTLRSAPDAQAGAGTSGVSAG